MITPVKIWRQTEQGKRVPFPVLCIMCGQRVMTLEAIIDLDGPSFYVEPHGCRPTQWPETVAGEDASAPLADAREGDENLDTTPEDPEI